MRAGLQHGALLPMMPQMGGGGEHPFLTQAGAQHSHAHAHAHTHDLNTGPMEPLPMPLDQGDYQVGVVD